jgi:two-component system, NtrC family, sensor kinase
MKVLIFSLFFLLNGITGMSQQITLDSLINELVIAKDTTKVNLLLEISKGYLGSDNEQAITYAKQAKALAEKENFPRGAAYALKNIGMAYYMQGQFGEVIPYWQQSLEVFTAIQDKTGMGNLLGNIGAVYFNQGNYVNALHHYLQALQVAEEIGDKRRIATTMGNIGAVYYSNPASHDKALVYYAKALEINEEIGYKAGIGTCLINIGEIYQVRGEHQLALEYSIKSLAALQEAGMKGKVAYALNNIAKVYAKQGNTATALEYHQKALETAEAASAKLEMTQSLVGIGKVQQTRGNHKTALATYQEAASLAKELGANAELKEAYEGIATAYGNLGDFKNGYLHRLLLSEVKDSLYSAESLKTIANLQANYENEKQQAQIDLLTKDKALQELDLQWQNTQRNALLAVLGLILVIVAVLFFNMRNKARTNRLLKKKNAEINEQKEEIAQQRDTLEKTYHNLVNTQAQLVQSEKMASLGQLTAGVAHEINNPINFVSAGIDSLRTNFTDITEVLSGYLALKPEADNKQQLLIIQKLQKDLEIEELVSDSEQLFQSIKNGATRTKEIVKSLRNFTRLDESSLKDADLQEGLDSTLAILNHQIKNRITVTRQYGNLRPVACYPGPLNQVFMNILSNAVQAIKGEGTIAVTTRVEDSFAIVSIKDSGPGMTEEVKKHIFEPFFTTKDVGEGTGLGLSISYGIVEKHQGKIEVNSKVGEGTEFIIRLPYIHSGPAEAVAESPSLQTHAQV